MTILLAIAATAVVLFVSVGYYLSGPIYTGQPSDHFNGKVFQNPTGVQAKGLGEVLKWMIGRKQGPWKETTEVTYGDKPIDRIDSGIRVTFVNHSTFLIQTEGLNILTDPVWSERTSPFTFAGPKRMRPPGIRFEDLPHIDVILISHNHYDHLDVVTMKRLVELYKPRIITPLGVREFLEQEDMKGATDLDWWQESKLSTSLAVQAVPAQHFSGRGMFDRDKTLWCGYVLKRNSGNLYFAGDTGYNDSTFVEIGKRCSPLLVSILPIGAYKPNWFMSPIHTSPADALKIFIDTQTPNAIASHFGTFPLADDGQQEPIDELNIALTERGISPAQFEVLREGGRKDFN
jgi:L-ascorbate metabolism protein UlaG (beta-lactamase superfamily)